jgi:hypothetical protein
MTQQLVNALLSCPDRCPTRLRPAMTSDGHVDLQSRGDDEALSTCQTVAQYSPVHAPEDLHVVG